jgi:hypothetical protein
MTNTLKNILLPLAAASVFLLPKNTKSQEQYVIAAGGIDTIPMVSSDNDTAKAIYWSRDGTSNMACIEIDGVLYIAKDPHYPASYHNLHTRKAPGKNYGYELEILSQTNGAIDLKFLGKSSTPEATPEGKEYLFRQMGDTMTINGNKFNLLGLGTNSNLYLKGNDSLNITLKPNEWQTIEGEKYMNNFSFSSPHFQFARVLAEEPTTTLRNKPNISFRPIKANGNGSIHDMLGRMIYSGPNPNEVARKVMSQNPSGTYIVRMPDGNATLERKIK